MTDKQKALKSIFEGSVDGGCSNVYGVIIGIMNNLPIEAKGVTFTLNDLMVVLKPLSNKWDKEIEKYLS